MNKCQRSSKQVDVNKFKYLNSVNYKRKRKLVGVNHNVMS